ncbi:MAG TPA: 3-ketoacyl-ACP reductase [Vicinamibacteria bacterium]|nr:3-ketoacyl-ACP reductase [Vicinamibacteria bacterium]
MGDLKRVALVTGGSRGIGLGIARCLARDGFDLAINGMREASSVEASLVELRALGADVVYIQADVAEATDRTRLLAAVRERFGRLDLLVNNAGVAPHVRADILAAPEESFDRVLRINLKGPYFLTQAAARWMIEERQADPERPLAIVNITSVSVTLASTSRGEYCVSKAGLAMSTRLWAVRLAEFAIPVYEVRPGIVATDMTTPVKDAYERRIAEGLVPQMRWGLPEDVGRAVAMLAAGNLSYSTGAVIVVDGGLTLPRL